MNRYDLISALDLRFDGPLQGKQQRAGRPLPCSGAAELHYRRHVAHRRPPIRDSGHQKTSHGHRKKEGRTASSPRGSIRLGKAQGACAEVEIDSGFRRDSNRAWAGVSGLVSMARVENNTRGDARG